VFTRHFLVTAHQLYCWPKENCLNLARIEQSFETTHTTSPAGAPLASIDGCRALLQTRGDQLTGDLLKFVTDFKRQVQSHFDEQIFLKQWQLCCSGVLIQSRLSCAQMFLGISGVDVEKGTYRKPTSVLKWLIETPSFFLQLLPIMLMIFQFYQMHWFQFLKSLQNVNLAATQTSLSWSIVPTVAVSMRHAYFADTEYCFMLKKQSDA
jgi:arginine decarboxylase